jgi:hypothetical protein
MKNPYENFLGDFFQEKRFVPVCPILMAARIMSRRQYPYDPRDLILESLCEETRCAWYISSSEFDGDCAIKGIGWSMR